MCAALSSEVCGSVKSALVSVQSLQVTFSIQDSNVLRVEQCELVAYWKSQSRPRSYIYLLLALGSLCAGPHPVMPPYLSEPYLFCQYCPIRLHVHSKMSSTMCVFGCPLMVSRNIENFTLEMKQLVSNLLICLLT